MENQIKQVEVSEFELFENVNPKIYSKKAIWGLSIFFTPVVGGILMMQNLIDVGKKKQGYIILFSSMVFFAFVLIIANLLEKPSTSLIYVMNLVGGLILTEYCFKKYFPIDTDFEKKKIWKPLIICLLVCILLFVASISLSR